MAVIIRSGFNEIKGGLRLISSGSKQMPEEDAQCLFVRGKETDISQR